MPLKSKGLIYKTDARNLLDADSDLFTVPFIIGSSRNQLYEELVLHSTQGHTLNEVFLQEGVDQNNG